MRHPPANDTQNALAALNDIDRPDFNIEEAADRIEGARADPVAFRLIVLHLLDKVQRRGAGLIAAKEKIEEAEGVIKKLTAPPYFPAVFRRIVTIRESEGPRAIVRLGATERVVGFGDGVESAILRRGDWVYLAHEQNVIVGLASAELGDTGETCDFQCKTADGRLLVKARDEYLVVCTTPALADAELKSGALLLCDLNTRFASELVQRPGGSALVEDQTPRETFDDIGGLGPQIEKVIRPLSTHFFHPEIARELQLPKKGSILLHGPPGTGKTLIAKALANWMARHAPGGRSFFMYFKPSVLEDKYFGESPARCREIFRLAREKAAANPGSIVVMFFDEVDSIGHSRGDELARAHDDLLTAFLAELDGLSERGDIIVIGATNRRDKLDPALLRAGRLGDLVIEVPRPDRRAAREIFSKHLRANMKYARNGHGDDLNATRAEIIDAAVSTIFSPNADNKLATITFRDGKRRDVHASQLLSGAEIRNIVDRAYDAVGARFSAAADAAAKANGGWQPANGNAGSCGIDTAELGLKWPDVELETKEWFATAAGVLTPENCRHHLSGLPQDIDVVNVELVPRKVAHPQRYLNLA